VSRNTALRVAHTALKYGVVSCGEEYTARNDYVGFNWISRKPIKTSRAELTKGRNVQLPAVRMYSRCGACGVHGAVFRDIAYTVLAERRCSALLNPVQLSSQRVSESRAEYTERPKGQYVFFCLKACIDCCHTQTKIQHRVWLKSPPTQLTIISSRYQLNKQVEQSDEFVSTKWMFTSPTVYVNDPQCKLWGTRQ